MTTPDNIASKPIIIRGGINDIDFTRPPLTRKEANKKLLEFVEKVRKERPTFTVSYQLIKHPLLRWWDNLWSKS